MSLMYSGDLRWHLVFFHTRIFESVFNEMKIISTNPEEFNIKFSDWREAFKV